MTSELAIAVHAIVFLDHHKDVESSSQIAQNVCTNPSRLRKVLAKLHKAELLAAKEGKEGGCYFALQPEEVSLYTILKAVDEKPVSVSIHTGDVDKECLIASGMGAIMDEIYGTMNIACEEVLKKITIADIEKKIFN